jgi:uncharacterized protein YjbI with pentapeptide repeats
VAAPPERWRTLLISVLIIVLAVAAGLVIGGALSWRGLPRLALVAGAAVAGALVVWVVVAPGWLAPPVPTEELAQLTTKARLEAADARLRLRHDLRNGWLQILAVGAVLAGAGLGYWQLAEDRDNARADRELTRQGQASERFTRAITQLGDKERVETRVGGIYGLAQVAEQVPNNNGPVGEVLLAYLNQANYVPRPKPAPTARLSEYAPDVQAALTVLTQYDKDDKDGKDYAWLSRRINLNAFRLRGADLHGAYLEGVKLRDAYLRDAVLSSADLREADLYRAFLGDADLSGAVLSYAFLPRADLSGTDLHGANLFGADLRHVYLVDTDLRGADLRDADLSEANALTPDLSGADLRGTNLRGTPLQTADLRGANLRGAIADAKTQFPPFFDWRKEGVQRE